MPPPNPSPRLRFLARVGRRQAEHLRRTTERLGTEDLGPEHLARLADLPELAERLDAFAARFGRLQDLLSDRLLPAALAALGETPGPALDNPDRAERFGWLDSADR